MSKTLGSFKINVDQGQFSDSEILVLLGENGTGKTTFIRMMAGKLEPDEVRLASDWSTQNNPGFRLVISK